MLHSANVCPVLQQHRGSGKATLMIVAHNVKTVAWKSPGHHQRLPLQMKANATGRDRGKINPREKVSSLSVPVWKGVVWTTLRLVRQGRWEELKGEKAFGAEARTFSGTCHRNVELLGFYVHLSYKS